MSDNFGVSNQSNNQLDTLVNIFKQGEQPKLNAITTKRTSLERIQTFYNGINSRLNAIVSNLDTFNASNIQDRFRQKSVESSGAEFATASATGDAVEGLTTVRVNRLASNDLLVSSRVNLADEANLSGTFNLKMFVGGEEKEISLELDGTETNEQVMKKLVSAMNEVEDINIVTSYVRDTSTTGRLSFTARNTGEDGRISFEDNAVFAAFGLNSAALNPEGENRTEMNGTSAGFRMSTVTNLNSEAVVNGITVSRSSNTLDEVVPGLNINLLKTQSADNDEVRLTTDVNVRAVEQLIQPLLDNFNIMLNFLGTDNNIRRSDPGVNSLRSRMRELVSQRVTTAKEGNPEFLTHIGISADNRGNLRITDSAKLKELLAEDPSKVADLFTSEDGFVKKIENATSALQGENGSIRARTASLRTQIDGVQNRFNDTQKRIDRQAEALRKQYTSMLKTFLEAQGQFNSFSSFNGGMGGGF